MIKKLFLFSCMLIGITQINAQSEMIRGKVSNAGEGVPNAVISIAGKPIATTADFSGNYQLEVPVGEVTIVVSSIGFTTLEKTITVQDEEIKTLDFKMFKDVLGFEEVVVSATRNRVERKKAPVVVSSIKSRLLNATQSISLAEGLNYAPGVRVEANCQNCGFTQVRLNGLQGPYTQILLNSRPVFSSLLGVYGLEQIPTSIIDRVEVVRSGGSALFGSNAIAGTVNVITKDPIVNSWEVGSSFSLIDGDAWDRNLTFNTSSVADDLKSGITLFGAYRNREAYDANDDGFTELVEIRNNTMGAKAFLKPNDRSRVSLNLNAIREYRRGGDQLDIAPQFTDITEQLDHDTFIGGADYEISSKDDKSKFQFYTSAAYTDRDSYYGGRGGSTDPADIEAANNAFGFTRDLAWVNGAQLTQNINEKDILTTGVEYTVSNTEDVIEGYNKLIDQNVNSLGVYAQYEWKPSEKFTLLGGTRLDNISVDGDYELGTSSRSLDVNQTAISPRIALSYLWSDEIRFRGGYARGFRAPQAFNEDLHVSGVAGEPQFVILSENLDPEYSNAFTGSVNYSKRIKQLQMDFLVEGFYTKLQDPFVQEISNNPSLPSASEEVVNGENATVFGSNFEFSVSPNPIWNFQLGGTLQQSLYDEPQLIFESDGVDPDQFIDEFTRVPNLYGFLNTSWVPNEKYTIDLTSTFTGSMTVPRIIKDSGFSEFKETDPFFDLNLKLERHLHVNDDFMFTFSGGVRNLFNSYQDDFDTGVERDANYVYGPGLPRTFFAGIKFGKLH